LDEEKDIQYVRFSERYLLYVTLSGGFQNNSLQPEYRIAHIRDIVTKEELWSKTLDDDGLWNRTWTGNIEIAGDIVAWNTWGTRECKEPFPCLYKRMKLHIFNLKTQSTVAIIDGNEAVVSKDLVAYQKTYFTGTTWKDDLYVYDVKADREVYVHTPDEPHSIVGFEGRNIILVENQRNYGGKVSLYQIKKTNDSYILTNPITLKEREDNYSIAGIGISGNSIVWGVIHPSDQVRSGIYYYNIAEGGKPAQLTSDHRPTGVDVDGDLIHWVDYPNHNADVYMMDLTALDNGIIEVTDLPHHQKYPAACSDILFWRENGDLYATEYQLGFLRGDPNSDGLIDVSDASYLLDYLFNEQEPPIVTDAGDVNDDGLIDISDVILILSYLFDPEVERLPEPFPIAGPDPTIDGL
jgi:hypothetical protein